MIEILIFVLGLFAIGSYKKDFTTLLFAGLGFVFFGFMILNHLTLPFPYNTQFGYLSICYGFYVTFRASLDLITYKRFEKDYD